MPEEAIPNQKLIPIEEIEDRRVALRRVLAPLITLEALGRVEAFNQALSDERSRFAEIVQSPKAEWVLPWLEDGPKTFETNTEAFLGILTIMTAGESVEVPQSVCFTDDQHRLVTEFMDEPEDGSSEKFKRDIRATLDAQGQITATMALPAYIATKYDCQDKEALLDVVNRLTLDDIIAMVAEEKFQTLLLHMSFAPNGTYAAGVNIHNVEPRSSSKYNEEWLHEEEAYGFGADEASIKPISYTIKRDVIHHNKSKLKGLICEFSIYDIFTKAADGTVVLDPLFVKSLRAGIKFDNEYLSNGDALTPTAGCPAATRKVTIRTDDFTADQFQALVMGERPVASYSPTSSELTIERNAIKELHQKHVAAIRIFAQKHRADA